MWKTLRHDIQVIFERDPAARSIAEVLLCYPGLHALWFHRVANWLWQRKARLLARFVSHLGRFFTGIEIHPGARIGAGFFIDHGMGVVIGETAEVGANVTLYHNVTLGGVSWHKGKRHPTIGDYVVVGAGAKILGPVSIGEHTRVGANSVVVSDTPANTVVVGVPGRIRERVSVDTSALQEEERRASARDSTPHDSHIDLEHGRMPDVTITRINLLEERIARLEHELRTNGDIAEADRQVEGAEYDGPWGI